MRRSPTRSLALLVAVVALAPAASASSLDYYGAAEGRAAVDVTLGYASFDQSTDKDGEVTDFDDANGVTPFHLAGAYGITKDLDVFLDLSAVTTSLGDRSGAGPRELVLGAGYGFSSFRIDLGYKLDIGSPAEDEAKDLPTSDGRSGLLLALRYGMPVGDQLSAEFGARLTFSGEDDDKVKSGLRTDIWIGLGYDLSDEMTLGLDLGLARKSDDAVDGDTVDNSDSQIIHLLPWFAYRISGAGTITLALAHAGENVTSGYVIASKRADKSSLPPISLRWSQAF